MYGGRHNQFIRGNGSNIPIYGNIGSMPSESESAMFQRNENRFTEGDLFQDAQSTEAPVQKASIYGNQINQRENNRRGSLRRSRFTADTNEFPSQRESTLRFEFERETNGHSNENASTKQKKQKSGEWAPPTKSILDWETSYQLPTDGLSYGLNESKSTQIVSDQNNLNQWVFVFGFPPSKATETLRIFSNFGKIIEKKSGEGNWMLFKYSTALEAKKAKMNGNFYRLSDGRTFVSTRDTDLAFLQTLRVDETEQNNAFHGRNRNETLTEPQTQAK